MLPSEDKIAILAFMCNVAISSKSVHGHMEVCEEELTSRRKEKIELNRTRKALCVDRRFLLPMRLTIVSQHRGARGPSRREQGE
jgi:bromodomain adjacent to zinc finger domain protein 1A